MIDSKQDYLELCTEAELIELPDKVRMGFMKERVFVKAGGRQQWADVCHASQKS